MAHIISLIVTYIIIFVVFAMLMRLAFKSNREQRLKKCMMNHPAGKLVQTEPLLIGKTYETFPNGSATRFNPPIPFDQPYHLEGD